ncbi:MAG TPA: hypothetical protein GXZ87_06770 [Bacteroidales bacterium]|nr:hypothetical protein [Bacteroidales bacterium]
MEKIYLTAESESSKALRLASLVVLIGGIASYVAFIIANSFVLDLSYSFSVAYEFVFSWKSVFTGLPILVSAYFLYALGNGVASIVNDTHIQKEIAVDTIDEEKYEVEWVNDSA